MKPLNRRFLLLSFLSFFFVFAPIVSAQNNDTGLSGSLETNHQNYFYKDPNKALLLAFFPGFLLHGYGHFYAGDNGMGTALLTGEIVSVVSIGAGALIKSDPNTFSGGILGNPTGSVDLANDMIWFGAIGFAAFWIVDMAHAPAAATEYNEDHGLKPIVYLENTRPTLALAYQF